MIVKNSLTADDVLALIAVLAQLGYYDGEWTEKIALPDSPESFAQEVIFVIVNSGMRFTVARGIYERVKLALHRSESAGSVFGHVGKAGAIDRIWRDRATYLRLFLMAIDKIEFLGGLPWIGPITKHHAARNLGIDTVKPDIHLQRLAAAHNTTPLALCERLGKETGFRVGTIDALLWRASALGILDSRTSKLDLEYLDAAARIRDRENAAFANAR